MANTEALKLFSLDRKRVAVTGAAGGIGQATASMLSDLGARLVLSDIEEESLGQFTQELKREGRDVWYHRMDLSDPESIEQGITQAATHLGGLDVLVNNAAARSYAPALEMGLEGWDSVLDVNLRGVFLASQAAARVMARERSGRIVNLASQLGLVASAGRVPYVTSKAGVIHLTRALALEWAELGILVNAVAPGPTDTPRMRSLRAQAGDVDQLVASVPLGRMGRPEEMAAAIAFLSSPAASFITGHTLVVDGGYTIH